MTLRVSWLTRELMEFELALEDAARIGVDPYLDILAKPEAGEILLGQWEVGIDLIERLERHERHAGRDILADIDLADAEAAGEGSDDPLLIDHRPGLVDAGGSLVAAGGCGVQRGLRHRAAAEQIALAGELAFGILQGGEIGLEIGLLDPIVDLDEQVALLDVVARGEIDVADDATHFCRYVNAGDGAQAADGVDPRGPSLGARRLGRHGDRRLRRIGNRLLDHSRQENIVKPGETAQQGGDHDKHQDEKTLGHGEPGIKASVAAGGS